MCYLHVKSQNRVKLCKFYVIDSKLNPIIGVNSACRLGLLKFTEPVFENWTDTTPIRSPELNVDAVRKTYKELSPDKSLSHDKVQTPNYAKIFLIIIKSAEMLFFRIFVRVLRSSDSFQ